MAGFSTLCDGNILLELHPAMTRLNESKTREEVILIRFKIQRINRRKFNRKVPMVALAGSNKSQASNTGLALCGFATLRENHD